jgi:hypothetical protein
VPVAVGAHPAERFRSFVGGHGFAGAEHPNAFLLLHGSGAAPGPQRDLIAVDRKVENVAWKEVQLVPKALGKDDAARSVEFNFSVHNAIVTWFHSFETWHSWEQKP